MVSVYNLNLQARAFHTLSQLFAISSSVRNSTLLQLFSMAMEMRHMSSLSPNQAYLNLLTLHKAHPNGLHYAPLREHISSNTFLAVTSELAQLSYVDFLTYAVPSLVCDPQKTFTILQKSHPEISYVEMTHHIIHVKLAYYQMDKLTKRIAQQGYDDILEVLYNAYTSIESTSILCKKDFLSLYSSINTFELSPKELAPKSRGSGFSDSDIDTIMELLTDQLQLTRPQQFDLVTKCFCSSAQAADIVCNEEIYNFTSI